MAFKKIGRKGSLTIPQQIRHELGIHGGTAVELIPTDDGGLMIRKQSPTCHVCGSVDDVAVINGFGLCKVCHAEFAEILKGRGENE